MLFPSAWAAPGVFAVRQYGAVGDGRTLDTAAFNAAIAACSAAGGGQVLVAPGRYLTGTIRLKSNITLQVEAGAEIVGTPDLTQYQSFAPPKDTPMGAGSRDWHRALVLGVDVENVTIAGHGIIDGNKVFDAHGEEHMRGPHGILFGNARDIVLRDITIRDAGNYAILLELTSGVEIRGIKVTGDGTACISAAGRTIPAAT
ncbi:MAG: glycosyl hydrolase family 28-related protein [Bryobacteraceae bacterium]